MESVVHRVSHGWLVRINLLYRSFITWYLILVVNNTFALGYLLLAYALVGHRWLTRTLMERSLLIVLCCAGVA